MYPHARVILFFLDILAREAPAADVEVAVLFVAEFNLALVAQYQACLCLAFGLLVDRGVEAGAVADVVDQGYAFVNLARLDGALGQVEVDFAQAVVLPVALVLDLAGLHLVAVVFAVRV